MRLVRFVVFTAVLAALGLYAVPIGISQEKSAKEKATVTGCLQKGDEAGEFSITGEDGKTYGLRSKTVDLSKHLGHKVTVSGTLRPESKEKERAEVKESEKKEAAEAGDIRVSHLKMVSEQCK
jgi:hypothetical protein